MKIDLDKIAEKVVTELPLKTQWQINDVPLIFDFAWARNKLEPISRSFLSCKIEEAWETLYVFGDQDYAESGGAKAAITVDSKTGTIFGFDLERTNDNIIFFINSDIDKYIESFKLFDTVLRNNETSKGQLEKELQEIDPKGYQRSDWVPLAKHISDISTGA